MEALSIFLAPLSALLWTSFALSPWGPWRNREVLEVADADKNGEPLAEITAVIPARNEAQVIEQSLLSLMAQGAGLAIILVDDGSEDGTAQRARRLGHSRLTIVQSAPLPDGWSGKLWALEQGRRKVTTRYTLFLDADIKLAPGSIRALKRKLHQERAQLISVMAAPSMASPWEKLLMPAFVYFFKALYPFDRVNSPHSRIAAAAGGCILVETSVLQRIGGLEPIGSAVIDDCALARRVKLHGFKIWLGLTHAARSVRRYKNAREIADMIARCAFQQLRHSPGLLILCTFVLLVLYVCPGFMIASSTTPVRCLSLAAAATMFLTYLPTLRFYRRSPAWALCLPFIALFFLAATWISAFRYWRGERTRWKGRVYKRPLAVELAERSSR
ncbi:MAG TPA: glycosyltransferase [Candidatus Acidoferrales bacterium]|nr:glycosyltransferase [Candidatus Acidoferrales bacterium]